MSSAIARTAWPVDQKLIGAAQPLGIFEREALAVDANEDRVVPDTNARRDFLT
jgi:hypothetical protein